MIPLFLFLTSRLNRQPSAAKPWLSNWWPSVPEAGVQAEAGALRLEQSLPPESALSLPALMVRIQDHLREILARHGAIASRVEPDFMQLGGNLQELYTDAGRLTEAITAVVGLLGSEESGVLADMRQLAELSLRELAAGRQEIATSLKQVEAISAQLAAFIKLAAELERLGLYLRVVGFTVGVECTRSAEASALFHTESQAVVQLAETILAVAAVITSDCQEVWGGQQEVLRGIGQSRLRLSAVSQEAGQAVQEAVGEIQGVLARAVAAMDTAEGHARMISEQIGAMVMRIQLHDSMSQRLAHAGEALDEVILSLNLPAGADDAARLRLLAKARRIILLQGGQISQLTGEITEARGRSREAFQVIASRVEALGASLTLVRDARLADTLATERTDSLSVLRQTLARLSLLVTDGGAMVEQLNAGACQASAMTARLSGRMRDIEEIGFTIHLKALNAIVKASGLGSRGRALDVLAQETKKLSDRARDYVCQAEAIHTTIIQTVASLPGDGHTTKGAGQPTGEALDHAVQAIAESLTTCNHDAAGVASRAMTLRERVRLAEDTLTFMDGLVAELSGYQERLTACAALLAPFVAGYEDEESEAGAARLQARYTMDHERLLHAAFFGAAPPDAGATPRDADLLLFAADTEDAATADSPDLGDNVELF